MLQCSALQSASRSLSVCLSSFFFFVAGLLLQSIVAEATAAPFVFSVQVKVRHLPPFFGFARKAELPAQELLSFSSVFSALFCFYFSCTKNKKRTKNKKLLQLSSSPLFQGVISLFAKPIFVCHVFSSIVCMSRYRDFILPDCC